MGSDHIPAELLQIWCNTLYSEFHKLIKCIWNKEELPQQWVEPITEPIYTKNDKIVCSNYTEISLLPTTFEILSNIM